MIGRRSIHSKRAVMVVTVVTVDTMVMSQNDLSFGQLVSHPGSNILDSLTW
jgi:hypothetical protein